MTEVPAAGRVLSPISEPSQRVGKRWIALIALANLGLRLGYYGPAGVLVPNQVQAIAGPSGKVAVLGWVTGTGAPVAMIANPVAGALSDRTTGRFGRRHPWTVCGALAGASALVLLAGQHTIAGLIVGWCLAQAGLNAMGASVAAGVPDRVPVTRSAQCHEDRGRFARAGRRGRRWAGPRHASSSMISAASSLALEPTPFVTGSLYPGKQRGGQPEVFPGQPTSHPVRVVCMKPSGSAAQSLAEVFRCRRSELVRLGAFILGDRQAAEDVVQDVFLRMHQRRDRLADLDDPLPYLRGAVVNGCRSVLRRRLLIRRHAGKEQPYPPLSAEEAMLLSEDRRQVLAALARLPARRREVLVLRYYAGLSEAEIAATLGISTGTVKSTAARGLAALARALKESR